MDLIKPLIWDNLVEGAVSALFSGPLAFFMAPPLGTIVMFLATKLTDKLYELMQHQFKKIAIDFVDKDKLTEFENRQIALMIIGNEFGIDSKEFKDARAEHKKAFAAHVSFRPGVL